MIDDGSQADHHPFLVILIALDWFRMVFHQCDSFDIAGPL